MSGKPFASWKGCNGTISWDSKSVAVDFGFIFGQTTEVAFAFKDIPAAGRPAVLDLYNAYLCKTSSVKLLGLEGTTPDGHRLRTDSLYLTAASLCTEHGTTYLRFGGSAGAVEVDFMRTECEVEDRGRMAFHTQGQRAFGPGVTGTCDVGTVSVQGDHNPNDFSQLTGCIVIDADRLTLPELDEWAARCDEQVDLLLDVFSIGEGRRIRWGARETYFGTEVVRAQFVSLGIADKPFQPMFPHLDLRPVLGFALKNYSNGLREELGIKFAVEWFLMAHPFTEVRYVACMTAIEHLVSKYLESHVPKGQRGVLHKKDARLVRKTLRDSLEGSFGILRKNGRLTPEDDIRFRPLLENAVNNINRKPLRVQLKEMLAWYGVPLDGIEEHLDRMVNARNDVVHRGFHDPANSGDASLRFYEDVVRELLKRIFLQVLGYRGRYYTWFGQHDHVEFKPGEWRTEETQPLPWWLRMLCSLPLLGPWLRRRLSGA